MNDSVARLARRAAADPLASRQSLFRELCAAPTFLLRVGERPVDGVEVEALRRGDSFPLWAETDERGEGMWVPLFSSPEGVAGYAGGRSGGLKDGSEFQWMEQDPRQTYGMLLEGLAAEKLLAEISERGLGLLGKLASWPALASLKAPPETIALVAAGIALSLVLSVLLRRPERRTEAAETV